MWGCGCEGIVVGVVVHVQLVFVLHSFLHGGSKESEKAVVPDKLQVGENETINIFSIASGHLYERFLRLAIYMCLHYYYYT